MTGKRKADDDIPGTSQPPAGPTPTTDAEDSPDGSLLGEARGSNSERGTEVMAPPSQLQPTGGSRERGRVIGEQVNSSQDDVPVRNSTIHIRMARYTAAAIAASAAAAISVNHPASETAAGAAVVPQSLSSQWNHGVPQTVHFQSLQQFQHFMSQNQQAFPNYDPRHAFRGLMTPQQLQAQLPHRPGWRFVPFFSAVEHQPQMAPARASNQLSGPGQMRQQHSDQQALPSYAYASHQAFRGDAPYQAFLGHVLHQAFLGDAPQNLLPPGPGPRPTPRAGINSAQHQMAGSSSPQSAQPEMRLQRGGASRHNRSNLPRDDAQQRSATILEATAMSSLQQQEKRQKLEQEQATMSALQEKLRPHHPAAAPQAQAQALFPVAQTVAGSRTLQLLQPQPQANVVSMCRACGVRSAMMVLDPTEHLCLCVDCFNATGDDPNTACPVCRAHLTASWPSILL